MKKFLDGQVPERAYRRLDEELEKNIGSLSERIAELQSETLDVDEALAFSEFIMTHAGEVWNSLPLDGRQRLQSAIFPTGLTVDTEKYRTPSTFLFYRDLATSAGRKGKVVDQTGIDPAG